MIIYILGTAVSVLFAKIASAKEINGKKLSKGLLRTLQELELMLELITPHMSNSTYTRNGSHIFLRGL